MFTVGISTIGGLVARYSTWMADNLIEAVRKRAEELDRPQSWVIEKALEEYLKIKAEKKPRGPQKAQPDTSPRPGAPRLRGQAKPKGESVPTAETPKKAPRNTALSREIVDEEQIEPFLQPKGEGTNIFQCFNEWCEHDNREWHKHPHDELANHRAELAKKQAVK